MDVIAVSHNYRRMAQSLAAEARAEETAGHHLTARKLRYKAAMVFDAARHELTDPDPPGVLGPRPHIVLPARIDVSQPPEDAP